MADNNTQQIIDKLSDANKVNNVKPNNKLLDRERHLKKVAIWKLVGKIALLIWIILAFARVPFVGSYIDGLIDYIVGFGKYLFYPFMVFVMIGWIFNTGYTRVIKTARFAIFSSIALLSACCIISGVTGMIQSFGKPLTFSVMITDYHNAWLSFFKNWHYDGFFNFYVTGGILAELISYLFAFLPFIVLIVLAVIILLIAIFVIFNINYKSTKIGLKLRGWMIRKLGGTFKYDGYNELKAKRDNQNKFKKIKMIEVEAIAAKNSCIPYELLPESDVNRFDANFKHARSIQNKLATLFRNNNIDCVPTDINVYSAFCEVCFEAKNKEEIKQMIKLQPKIAKIAKVDHFNISIRGNIINIEIENILFSKFSLRTIFDMYDQGKDVTAVIGLDKKGDLCYQNFRNNPSALIVGKRGSGAATLTVLMALSACYLTHPDNLELVMLNPNCEDTYSAFYNTPHVGNKTYDAVNKCTEKLHDIQKIVNERNSLLNVNNLANIDQYNQANKLVPLKHILVIIGNVDSILKETFQNNKIISDILTNGPKAGVYLVMQSYIVNNDILDKAIYDNVCDKYILALGSQDESIKIFNNHRGYQLHGNGDCLHFVHNKVDNMKRMQICNMNFAELTTDLDIIRTFYAVKQEQKEKQILMEAKNEENR